jgi:hypothetical protein
MRARLESNNDFKGVMEASDAIELLCMIRDICFNFLSQKSPALSIHESMRKFYMQKQGKQMTCDAYLDQFTNSKDIVEHVGRILAAHPTLGDDVLEELGREREMALVRQMVWASSKAKERYLATAFLCGADRDRYQELLVGMENSYLKGVDEYPPKTMTAAYSLLTNWKQDTWNLSRLVNAGMGGVAFTKVGGDGVDDDAEADGTTLATGGERQRATRAAKDKSHIKCFRCGMMGHCASECTVEESEEKQDEPQSGTQLLMAAAASAMTRDSATTTDCSS